MKNSLQYNKLVILFNIMGLFYKIGMLLDTKFQFLIYKIIDITLYDSIFFMSYKSFGHFNFIVFSVL